MNNDFLADCADNERNTASSYPGVLPPGGGPPSIISGIERQMRIDKQIESPYDGLSFQSKSVFITFTATGANALAAFKPIYFQPDTDLNCERAVIRGIELISSVQMSVSPAKVDNLPLSTLKNGWLVLSNRKRERIVTKPLTDLNTVANGGKITRFYVDKQEWANCYIELADTTGITLANGLNFRIWYENNHDLNK